MADNVTANPGTGGAVFATDEIDGVHYPRHKLVFGDNGVSTGDVSGSNPLPVGIVGAVNIGNSITLSGVSEVSAAELTTLAGAIKAEDSASADGDPGIVILAQRRDTDASIVSTDGDYGTLKMDEEGRLKVATKPASYAAVTGNITANGQTVFADCTRFSNLMVHCTGTFSTVNVTFEGSLNSTTGSDGNWFTVQAIRSNANTIETATGNLSAAPAYAWELSVNALKYFRVRATAFTSGTQVWTMVPGTYATEPIPGAQISGTQPVSGTVTVTSTRITPNAADGHSSTHHLIAAGTTNATSVKASAGAIGQITVSNAAAAVRYFKLYNLATAPTVGTSTPVMTALIPAGQTVVINGNSPIRCSTGIAYALTTGIAVADTGAVTAADMSVSIFYT